MGAVIQIRLQSDPHDEFNRAPYLGRDFHYEITRGSLWEGRPPFLTESEAQLLEAPYDESSIANEIGCVDPKELTAVILKVSNYLKDNEEELPFEIDIDYERMERAKLPTDLIVNGSKCWIQGDSHYYTVSSIVKVVSMPMEPTDVELWIDVANKIEIQGRTYYLQKTTRYQKYKNSFEEIIEFCKQAITMNEKISWLYHH